MSALISTKDPTQIFQLLQQIGSGSYGTVQKARIIKSGQLAAVKLINMEDGEEYTDVQNEITMLDKCKHENVVSFYGSFIKGKTIWICMEFCAGGSVADIMTSQGAPFSENELLNILYYTLAGLDYLHTQHMVHRDIKGGNILLTDTGVVKLADLGVSAQLTSTIAKRKSFIGTPYWIAPEIIAVEMKMGPDGYTNRCDIWSVGIVAIELAEMAPPMFDLHPMRALYLIPKNPSPKLNEKGKWSKNFREFVKDALVKNPAKRPSAVELMKHSWFKALASTKGTLEETVQKSKRTAELKQSAPAAAVSPDPDSDDESATLKPAAAAQAKHILAQSKVDAQEMQVTTMEAEATYSNLAGAWQQPRTQFVPIGAAPGVSSAAPALAKAEAKSPAAAAVASADGQASSFVLSNVFAGCPLKIVCAASWKCVPPGASEPVLYIIVGAETGLYFLETRGDKRELVQISKRMCTWLYVMDDEGMMISVSGKGLVCVHDLNSLLVTPGEEIKFKTTKLIEGAKGGRCAVTRTPDNGFTFLCAVISMQLVLMQWYAPRKKFMKLKDFETPFDEPPPSMDLLVLKDRPLPVLCVGATRDKKTRAKAMAIVDPNVSAEDFGKHMSAELGWVRVRSGREDVYATSVKQVGENRFLLCFSNVAQFVDTEGNPSINPGDVEKVVFEVQPDTVVFSGDAVIGFSDHRLERRSLHTGRLTHQMKDKGDTFRVVGREGNIIIETRAAGETAGHLYLLLQK